MAAEDLHKFNEIILFIKLFFSLSLVNFQNDSEDDQINTEDDLNFASNSENKDYEVDNENSSTSSLLDTDIEEVNTQMCIAQFLSLLNKCLPFKLSLSSHLFTLLTCRTSMTYQIPKQTCLMLQGVKMKTMWTVKI